MRSYRKLLFGGLLFWGIGLVSLAAQAQSPPATPAGQDLQDLSELGQALPEEGLGRQDGRQDTQIEQLNIQMTEMQSSANLGGNTLSASNSTLTTGINSIADGAFTNANGIVTVIQNSGNQVLIQNDMILNLWVK